MEPLMDIEVRFTAEISVSEANVLNQLSIIAIGAWGADTVEFKRLIQESPKPLDEPFNEPMLFKYLRSELCLLTMQQLAFAYFVNPRKGVETLTQNALADLIGLRHEGDPSVRRKKQDSNRKRLGDWILPALNQARLIEEYDQKGHGDYRPHRLKISRKGIEFMLQHYANVKQLTSPLFEEWNAANAVRALEGTRT
jgi:hypothetical protein